jgi:tRNA pseudouridine55 synthase
MIQLPHINKTINTNYIHTKHTTDLTFRAAVSAGTYIRALARDLGNRLGVGAHLTSLRREAIGSLRVEDAVLPDRVTPSAVLPARRVLHDMPGVDLDDAGRNDVIHGRAVVDGREAGKRGSGEVVALLGNGEVVAVATAEDGWLRPTVVLEAP